MRKLFVSSALVLGVLGSSTAFALSGLAIYL